MIELRPCPFCKRQLGNVPEPHGGLEYECSCFKGWVDSQVWQNAYCWKEIDRLKEELADREKTIEILKQRNSEWVEFHGNAVDALRKVERERDAFKIEHGKRCDELEALERERDEWIKTCEAEIELHRLATESVKEWKRKYEAAVEVATEWMPHDWKHKREIALRKVKERLKTK